MAFSVYRCLLPRQHALISKCGEKFIQNTVPENHMKEHWNFSKKKMSYKSYDMQEHGMRSMVHDCNPYFITPTNQ